MGCCMSSGACALTITNRRARTPPDPRSSLSLSAQSGPRRVCGAGDCAGSGRVARGPSGVVAQPAAAVRYSGSRGGAGGHSDLGRKRVAQPPSRDSSSAATDALRARGCSGQRRLMRLQHLSQRHSSGPRSPRSYGLQLLARLQTTAVSDPYPGESRILHDFRRKLPDVLVLSQYTMRERWYSAAEGWTGSTESRDQSRTRAPRIQRSHRMPASCRSASKRRRRRQGALAWWQPPMFFAPHLGSARLGPILRLSSMRQTVVRPRCW